VNPFGCAPAAPLTAAIVERREIDRATLSKGFVRLKESFDFVAVEGVGGWKVPITTDYFTSDLAAEFRLPVLLIAQNRLGCLNHVFLTLLGIEGVGECGSYLEPSLARAGDRHDDKCRNSPALHPASNSRAVRSGRPGDGVVVGSDVAGNRPIFVRG
jgi:hypothetical protein